MNITKEGDDMNFDKKLFLNELYLCHKLLEECLYLLNEIPNKKYKPKSYKDSYELASKINNYLKQTK